MSTEHDNEMEHERLHPEDVEAIALRVSVLMAQASPRYLNAAELAARYGVSIDWIYERSAQLGATALGDGPKPRKIFNVAVADKFMADRAAHKARMTAPRKRRPRRRNAERTAAGAPLRAVKPSILPVA